MITPLEGIDVVKVLLNPYITNISRPYPQLDPHNHLTLHPAGAFHALSIHAEYFNIYEDYQWQIATAIHRLIKRGLITFPDNEQTLPFIYNFPGNFILRIIGLEFYSMFRPENVSLVDDAIENGDIVRYYDKIAKEYTQTFYSADGNQAKGRKALVIDYDKSKKDIEKRKVSQKEWAGNPYKKRLEFRLYSNNCLWLHWYNLRGNYFDIFKRYSYLLAAIYNNHIYGKIEIKPGETKQFKKMMRKATAIRDSGACRYQGERLKQMEPIPLELSHPEEITAYQNEHFRITTNRQFDAFSKKQQNKELV
ncbi:hypothetical protein FACS1894137_13840 [Spirochaetia bacterium]|nr:hypothetical protein FACS1894137_13840 [Spirochaetia bacterium]